MLPSGEPARGQPPQQRGDDDDLEHVAARLHERGAERQRAVVVGEQVADEHAGPQPEPAEIEAATPTPTGSHTIAATGPATSSA